MTEVLINNFEYIMKARERVIFGLCAIVIALVAGYGYFVVKTTVNTVALQSIQTSLAKENQTVSSLSARYVALSSGVTMQAALADGFAPAPVSAFVTVPAESPALTINAF